MANLTKNPRAAMGGAAEVAIVLLDAAEPISEQDQRVLGLVTEADIERARQQHRMPTEAELARVPVPRSGMRSTATRGNACIS